MAVRRSPAEILDTVLVSFVQACSKETSAESQKSALDVLRSLLNGEISGDEAISRVEDSIGTGDPAQKLLSILTMDPEPIPAPSIPDPPEDQVLRQKPRNWSEYEDHRLLAAIHRFGVDDWHQVSMFVGNGRTRSQCGQRWNRGLNPQISKDAWTQQEEDDLVALVTRLGEKSWKRVAAELGNRSDVQCRYRYQQLRKSGVVPPPVPRGRMLPTVAITGAVADDRSEKVERLLSEESFESVLKRGHDELWRETQLRAGPRGGSNWEADSLGASFSMDD
jgi:hypothetical protein